MTVPTPNEWHQTDKAKALLAEADAAGIMADRLRGFGWRGDDLRDRILDIDLELDDLRDEAVKAFANGLTSDRESDEWFDAEREADNEAPTVGQALKDARRAGAGIEWLQVRGA